MAVASPSAERIDVLPMDASPSKSVSDSASDSPTSCAADDPYLNDHSNSFPSPNRDIEIQSAALLRSEEYRQLFRLPPEEALVQDFNCAFQESILLQGHMYLFVHYICFYSNIFGFETKKIIPFHEITSVKRAKTAGIFPNAIEIFAGGRKYFFASFLSRDEAFKLINVGWLQNGNGVEATSEQQESISGYSSQENGLDIIEKVNSFKQVNELEPDDRQKEALPSNDSKPSPDIENGNGSRTLAELQDNVEQAVEPVEPVGNNTSLSSTKPWAWNVENFDAPEIPKSYTRVADSKFPIKVEEFFNLFFSDAAINFIDSFHRRCGDKEFRCSLWCPDVKFGQSRDVSFQHPIKIYFGAKFGSCQEVQKFRVYRNSHVVVETSQEINDVPYGDHFRVEGLWDLVRDGDDLNEGCILRIYVDVAFSKKTVFKGRIIQSTLEECREAYALWINMAHELLKQKNLEKQEGEGAADNVTQNGEIHSGKEVKTEEASESSHKFSDHARVPQMSGSMDANQRVGDLVPENILNATSLASPLGDYAKKFFSFLRTQSQITLILVVAFAVIFLMQVSILVLLNRPQKLQVTSPEYYGGGRGGGVVERSAEAVAWLERRMHHLKDEMFMVEARLERLQREHKWLKAQLKDLDNPQKRKQP